MRELVLFRSEAGYCLITCVPLLSLRRRPKAEGRESVEFLRYNQGSTSSLLTIQYLLDREVLLRPS